MAGQLTGKHAVVTGGAAGIGLATAQLFAREGARVAILDRDGDKAERCAIAMRGQGLNVTACHADASDEDDVCAAFARITTAFDGILHILVNNAGIAEFASVEETSLESFQRILTVNVSGTFLCCRAALPALRRHGGAIVNMASVAGLMGIPRMAAYCASKAAIIGLTRQMAVDYTGHGIRVNCLCPGRIEGTDLDRWIRTLDSEETTAAKRAKYPIGRFGYPDEVAQAALYLASDAAGFVSGSILTIDGGITAS